ncbi:hypothetical protein SGLAM104S_05361 [Streptomyces glaucescens]
MHSTARPRLSGTAALEAPLRGRVAVVTGAARGIGEALARRLSAAGMHVALVGREARTLHAAASSLTTPSQCVEADVTDQAALDEAARQVADGLGAASVVVANAGVAAGGPFRMTDADLWRRVVEVNLVGAANTARAFLPQLTRTRGYFLQVASTAAFGSAPMMSAYCASKAGAESFAQSLRGELEPDGIAVGIGYLHWTGTDMIAGLDAAPGAARPARRPAVVRPPCAHAGAGRRLARHRCGTPVRPCLRTPLAALVPAPAPAVPLMVSRIARREMRRRPAAEFGAETGFLGAGGRARLGGVHLQPRAVGRLLRADHDARHRFPAAGRSVQDSGEPHQAAYGSRARAAVRSARAVRRSRSALPTSSSSSPGTTPPIPAQEMTDHPLGASACRYLCRVRGAERASRQHRRRMSPQESAEVCDGRRPPACSSTRLA